MGAPVRVVVADDDVLLREGLASLLERAGFDVVGQAGDGTQLLDMVRGAKPELVVADIRMPPTHTTEGLDAARVIRDELPDTAILVLSAHVDIDDAMELLAGGHRIGYLLKTRVTDVADFIETVVPLRGRSSRRGGSPSETPSHAVDGSGVVCRALSFTSPLQSVSGRRSRSRLLAEFRSHHKPST